MKNLKRYYIISVYYIFCIICTIIIGFHCGIILFNSIFTIFDFQVLLFFLLSFLLISGFWVLPFVKIHISAKILIFTLLFCFQLNYIKLLTKIPSINHILDEIVCLDTGICKEGISVNTQYGTIKINKQNCLKYDWIWDEHLQCCKIHNL